MTERFTYQIDVERNVLVVRVPLVITLESLIASMDELRADGAHDPLRPALFDMRGTNTEGLGDALARVAEAARHSPIAMSTPRALLVTSDAAFDAAHRFSVIAQAQGRYFGVFRDFEAAVKWLSKRRLST